MDALSSLLAAFACAFQQQNRQFSLRTTDTSLDGELLPHTLVGHEQLSAPYRFQLECLCADVTLELKTLLGQGVDIVIHGPVERTLSGIITAAQQLGSDGGFARYGLTVEPAFSVLALRRNSRVFQDKSVVEIIGLLLDEHIGSNPVFAQCFRHRQQLTQTYPTRSYCQQYRESDLAFIERLLREEGISYYFDFAGPKDSPRGGGDQIGLHTLVLFDANAEFAAAPQKQIRFHRADATEADDTLTEWQSSRQIHSGAVQLASFDYRGVYTQEGSARSAIDHGDAGSGLYENLEDYDPQSLYYGADNSELARYAILRQQALDISAKTFTGSGVVRGIGPGQWFALMDHPIHDQEGESDRQFIVTHQRLAARNNFPSELEALPIMSDMAQTETGYPNQTGYRSQIEAVRKSIPIVPAFSHTQHAKPSARGLQTATVVGPVGEEIFTDASGRIKIQFHWMRPQDHDVARHGASADKNDKFVGRRFGQPQAGPQGSPHGWGDHFSSCWVRVAYPSAGAAWGHQFIPRIGQEVLVEFIEGDIDRPIVVGAVYNGQHNPPSFSDAGSLPANKMLSGIKSKEYQGNRYNELVLDDTTGEIRTKLSSEHGKTQLNQGYLIHPRTEGKGTLRGEGFELRTDNAGAVRAAQGLLLTTEPQPHAGGKQLDRNIASAQLDAAANLADQLGDNAKAQHANRPETGKSNRTIDADSQAGPNKTRGHLHHLKAATRNLERGTNTNHTDSDGKDGEGDQAGQQPLLILSGQNGIAITTPQSTTIASGSNFDHIAQRDLHHSTGKRWIHNVGESISIFVAGAQNKVKDTFKLLAAKGDVQLQAQSTDIEITADKNIQLHAVKQKQTWSAQKNILITCGGAYIKIEGGNIDLHCPGTLTFKGRQHAVTGPAGMAFTTPHLPRGELKPTDLEFRYVSWIGEPIAGERFRATLSDGSVRNGITDAQGHIRISGVPPGTTATIEYLGNTQPAKSTIQTIIDDDVQAFLSHPISVPTKDGV